MMITSLGLPLFIARSKIKRWTLGPTLMVSRLLVYFWSFGSWRKTVSSPEVTPPLLSAYSIPHGRMGMVRDTPSVISPALAVTSTCTSCPAEISILSKTTSAVLFSRISTRFLLSSTLSSMPNFSVSSASPVKSVRLWTRTRTRTLSPSVRIEGSLTLMKKSLRVMVFALVCPTKVSTVQPHAVNRHCVVFSGMGIFAIALPLASVTTSGNQYPAPANSFRTAMAARPVPRLNKLLSLSANLSSKAYMEYPASAAVVALA